MADTAAYNSTMAATLAPVAQSKRTHNAATAGTVGKPGVLVDQFTAGLIKDARVAMGAQTGTLILYSDGSLKKDEYGRPSCAFSSVFSTKKDEFYDCAVLGRTATDHCSYVAELAGLLGSILACPRNRAAIVHTDLLSSVYKFREVVLNRETFLLHRHQRRYRKARLPWWDLIYQAYVDQGRKITVKWVKGHSGIKGNEVADKMADFAHQTDYTPWRISTPTHAGSC